MAIPQKQVITPADLSSDFDVTTQVALVEGTQSVYGKVRFCTSAELTSGATGVAVAPHDIQQALSGSVPALGGNLGIKVQIISGVNTIGSTLGDGSRVTLV